MRIVLKVSGESLKGKENIESDSLDKLYSEIKELSTMHELIVVVGGGNFWRGRNDLDIESSVSDTVGMLATIMNSLAISSYLNKKGIDTSCYSSFSVDGVIERCNYSKVCNDLKNGKVVIFGGGLGIPNLSTDMTTVSKAVEYNADLILMAKNVDGIYDKNPSLSDAKLIKELTHQKLFDMSLRQGTSSLMVIDIEALAELVKHKIPMYVYKADNIKEINEVLEGKKGSKVFTK